MVHIVNLGVGLILAGVLVVAFCKRHKWTNGKSIVEHLLKWRIWDLVGDSPMGRHKEKGQIMKQVPWKKELGKTMWSRW